MLYPTNALVADQVERADRWLENNPTGLSVFHFTRETPENERQRAKRGEPESTNWRIRTRKEARDRVPDIIITNYSMLEYMLCRPQDQKFFGPELRAIVLDEAHLYGGTMAAEIALLLRRVRQRCGVQAEQLLQIATSATLGGKTDDLRRFAAALFSTHEKNTRVIFGPAAQPVFEGQTALPERPCRVEDLAPYAELELRTLTAEEKFVSDSQQERERLKEALKNLVSGRAIAKADSDFPDKPGLFLWKALSGAELVRRLAASLYEDGTVSLGRLSQELFDRSDHASQRACVALLRLAASARLSEELPPLVPHRLHFLVRAPEGQCACLNAECSGPGDHRLPNVGCLQPVAERCRYCASITLAVHRCTVCGQWALAALENRQTLQLRLPLFDESEKQERRYYLTSPVGVTSLAETVVDLQTGDQLGAGERGVRLFRAPCPDHGAECRDTSQCRRQRCPRCRIDWSVITGDDEDEPETVDLKCKPLRGPQPIAMSVLAETILSGMPVYPGDSRAWKPR